jgi:hypothetical protein
MFGKYVPDAVNLPCENTELELKPAPAFNAAMVALLSQTVDAFPEVLVPQTSQPAPAPTVTTKLV